MKYQVYNLQTEKVKDVELNPEIFDIPINQDLVHQALVAQMANSRKNYAHTKGRGEVRGGGRKPWRQKGTGRARHGSIRSPLWVGGGVTFGPTKYRNYSQKLNKKMKKKAILICLSDRVKDKQVTLVDKFDFKNQKTKEIVEALANLKEVMGLKVNTKLHNSNKQNQGKGTADLKSHQQDKSELNSTHKKFDIKDYYLSILVIASQNISAINKMARNISGIKVIGVNSLNVYDLLSYKHILTDTQSVAKIEELYALN